MHADFFPYQPARLRLTLLLSAVACVALAAWAVASAASGAHWLEWARAGLCLGLLGAMLYVWSKLAPRGGWGVTLEPTGVRVSRPLWGEVELRWADITDVRRVGRRRDTLVLVAGEAQRAVVPRQLFASEAAFSALVAAVDERLPSLPHDA